MAHCTVRYLFEDDIENGGKVFLIACNRCARFKVPLRDVMFSSRDPVTQRLTFKDNAIKHKKGVPYLVDCNVTDPLFPLKYLWEHNFIPNIEALVAPGGLCHGAQVIFQEDNAGPHTEGIKCGTATDPLFPLKYLREHNLIPNIEALVAPGGACHGAQVIFQEDNAGPHTEGIYHEWLNEQFAAGRWRVELQAPQGLV
jgi:hypothetical protein